MSVTTVFISRCYVVLFMYSWSCMMDSHSISWVLFKQHLQFVFWVLGPKTHIVRCFPGRLFCFYSILFWTESNLGSIPIFPLWPRIFYFAFQRFRISTRFSEQIFSHSCLRLVITSWSLETSRWSQCKYCIQHSFTQRFLFISELGDVPFYCNSLVTYLKTCFCMCAKSC